MMPLNAHSQMQVFAPGFFSKVMCRCLNRGDVGKFPVTFELQIFFEHSPDKLSQPTAMLVLWFQQWFFVMVHQIVSVKKKEKEKKQIKLLIGCIFSLGHVGFCSNRNVLNYLHASEDPWIVRCYRFAAFFSGKCSKIRLSHWSDISKFSLL